MFRESLWGEALIQVQKVTTKLNGTLEEKKKNITGWHFVNLMTSVCFVTLDESN